VVTLAKLNTPVWIPVPPVRLSAASSVFIRSAVTRARSRACLVRRFALAGVSTLHVRSFVVSYVTDSLATR